MGKRVAVLVVSGLVLAACGGGDDDSFGGGSDESWCALAQRIEDSSDTLDGSFEAGNEALDQAFSEFSALLSDAKRSAPDEISDAVNTAANGTESFRQLLAEVDFDVFALDEQSFAEFDALGDEMEAATDQLETYNLRECGIAPSSDDSPSSDQPPVAGEEVADEIVEDPSVDDDQATGIVVTYVGDSNSDWCVASRQLDIESDRLDSLDFTDPVAMEAAFTDLIGMYEGAVPLAPPELKDYVSISISELLTLQAVLVAVDYNFVNADLSALDDLGGIVQNANDNIELYNEQVCGTPAGVDSGETVLGADNGGFDPGAGTIRDQAVAEFVNSGFTEQEASCIFDNLDFTDPAVGDDTNAIVAVFDLCAIDLARLAELGG